MQPALIVIPQLFETLHDQHNGSLIHKNKMAQTNKMIRQQARQAALKTPQLLPHMVVDSLIQFGVLSVKRDMDVEIHVPAIASVGFDTERAPDLLP